ncbi:MAG: thiolase domain-containing protein [Candidatus Brocadiia bacterium]
MRDVAIIGIGMTRFGELWEKSLRDLMVEAGLAAIADAGVDRVDSMYVGCMSSGLFAEQEHLASLASDFLGLGPIPATRVESACASGGLAVRSAFIEVASGLSDVVLAIGVEKMTDVAGDACTAALATAADQDYEAFHGVTFPGLYAMIARAHMERYGTTGEQLAAVAVKNHANGALNPLAQFRNRITVEDVLDSMMVADPLHILDCSPVTDGAAAAILCPLEMAKKIAKKAPVRIAGIGHATDSLALYRRADLTRLPAVERSGQIALKMAKRTPADIQLAEVHDCFTIAEVCAIEELGFVPRGQGGDAARSGLTARDGRSPVNTSGGLKSKGHPVGATGVAQINEVVTQLRGEAGERQVRNARIGLTQNMGGSGGSSVVHVLELI